jgi:hypothetical protein
MCKFMEVNKELHINTQSDVQELAQNVENVII